MSAAAERQQFSERLRQALATANYAPDSPTVLAREFNIRTSKPVTVHATRKWLVGEAIPTQEKVRELAAWLGASLNWLRFGEAGSFGEPAPRLDSVSVRLATDIHRLDEHHQQLARDFIRMLVRANARVGASA